MTVNAPVITSPHDGDHLDSPTVSVSGTVDQAGTVTVYDGEATVATTSATTSFSASFSASAGEHRLSACLTAGDETSAWSPAVVVTVGTPITEPTSEPTAAVDPVIEVEAGTAATDATPPVDDASQPQPIDPGEPAFGNEPVQGAQDAVVTDARPSADLTPEDEQPLATPAVPVSRGSLSSDSPATSGQPVVADVDETVIPPDAGNHVQQAPMIGSEALAPDSPAVPQPAPLDPAPAPEPAPEDDRPVEERFREALAQWIDAGSHDHLEIRVREIGREFLEEFDLTVDEEPVDPPAPE